MKSKEYRGPDWRWQVMAASEELFYALQDAILQIEYLHEKFQPTGSGEAVLAKARAAIAKALGEANE